jgi:hypothetical protein
MAPHTMVDDFQHFLSYSGLSDRPLPEIMLMLKGFEGAWEPHINVSVEAKFDAPKGDLIEADMLDEEDKKIAAMPIKNL